MVSDQESAYIWDYFDKKVFSDIDFILSCGDLSKSYLEFLATMVNAPLFYVPGNHDKSFVEDPPEGCTNIDRCLVTVNGLRILGIGGCRSPNSSIHQYTEKQMSRCTSKLGSAVKRFGGVDILLTHAPAFGLGDGKDLFHTGFECYVALLDKYQPKYHFYGHQHKNYSHEKPPENYKNTRLVNVFGYKILDI
ncbi:MAG: metallophosphoesterase [Oscillospiraceae bacterium]|nr:metallophosphoesterase [Oscillospiraceae bacterium]